MVMFRTLAALVAVALLCTYASLPSHERWRFEQQETSRLHAHFNRMVADLSQRDQTNFSEAQRASRARLVSLLRDYDRLGRFPRNEGQRQGRTPIFVDRHETRCAMAYLIEHAGGASLVARIAATTNLARIHELADDPELGHWLADAGLDLDEATRIQPAYGSPPGPSLDAELEDHFPDDALMSATTLLSVGLGVPAMALSLTSHGPWAQQRQAAVLALLVGTQSVGMGLLDGLHDSHLRGSGYTQLAIGACALTLGVLRLHAGPSPARASAPGSSDGARTTLAVRPGQQGETQVGFAVRF